MSDLIDRQAVLEILTDSPMTAYTDVQQLPSVTPTDDDCEEVQAESEEGVE